MIAEKSSDTSNLVTMHIHQLAVATGAPDWKELTLDDAKVLYIQGDKYLLGYGLTQSFDMAFKRYTVNKKFKTCCFKLINSLPLNGVVQKPKTCSE